MMVEDRPLRILYVSLSALGNMNAQTIHTSEICDQLRRLGNKVDLVRPPKSGSNRLSGVASTMLQQTYFQLSLIGHLRQYDLIFLRGHPSAFVLCIFIRLLRIPLIYEVNGLPSDTVVAHPRLSWALPILKRIEWFQYASSSAIVAVTEDLAAQIRVRVPTVPVTVVTNAGNPELFKPAEHATRQKKYIVFVSSLAPWHDLDTALSATSDPEWPAEVELVVIGEGARSASLKSADTEKKYRVRYLGPLARDQVAAILSKAMAALILISNPKGRSSMGVMPLKLFDAMSCGIPVIVSDLPGQAELVQHFACGYVVPSEKSQPVARAVKALHLNSKEAAEMGARGRSAILNEHSWHHRAEAIDKLMRQLTSRTSH